MNKIIKFRIFHPRRNKMILPEELIFTKNFSEWHEAHRVNGFGFSDYDSLNDILMQYIGINDKDNIEIFEDDIVDICRNNDENNIYRVHIKDIRNIPQELFGSSFTWCKIVGNIHQNLDLLN